MDVDRQRFDEIINKEIRDAMENRVNKFVDKIEEETGEPVEKTLEQDEVFNQAVKHFVTQAIIDWLKVYDEFADETDKEDLKNLMAERYGWNSHS